MAPTTISLKNLEALTPTVLTATYTSGARVVTDTYAGASLWDLLQSVGGPVLDAAAKNDSLSHYVVATGSDGYSAVFSLGELDPRFGAEKVLVAYADTLGQLGPAGDDGYARIVASEDTAGGRYVSDLASLEVVAGPEFQRGPGGLTSAFSVSGEVAHPGTLGLDSLAQLGATTVSVTYQAGSTPVSDIYSGVPLWDLLQSTGVLTDPAIKNDILDKVVVATGSDGYRVAFSLGELSPNFGHEQVLVAYADTAGQLGSGGTDGFARLVVPDDTAGGRYVSNLTDLQVIDVVHQHAAASTSVWG